VGPVNNPPAPGLLPLIGARIHEVFIGEYRRVTIEEVEVTLGVTNEPEWDPQK